MGADEGRARTRALNLPESEQQSGASYYGAGGGPVQTGPAVRIGCCW